MEELKPCPFCGSEAEVCEGGINGRMRVYGLVEHKDGCFFLADGLPVKYQHIMGSDFAAWNKRAEQTCTNVHRHATDDGNNGACIFECSRCGFSIDTTRQEYTDGSMIIASYGDYDAGLHCSYCPHCGAKVVG